MTYTVNMRKVLSKPHLPMGWFICCIHVNTEDCGDSCYGLNTERPSQASVGEVFRSEGSALNGLIS